VSTPVEEAAARLRAAAQARRPCAPVRELIGAQDLDAAYAVQELGTLRRLAEGARLSGRKIGLTSVAVQKQLGVDEPDCGMLFADMQVPDGEGAPAGWLLQPRAEAEIAFVLGRDLNREAMTAADVMRAVDYAVCAIEIVDSRIENWDIRIADTIADNASAGLYVLGARRVRLADVDLEACRMVARKNGAIISQGSGADCLGNPLNAALWLAQAMVRAGRPLAAGDVVLSGALGPMVAVAAGDRFATEIEGFGAASLSFPR